MATRRFFDPDRVAYFETEGWRAYYDRRWPRLLRLLVTLCHAQFGIPWPQALLAAYYATRASLAWVPLDHDAAKVQRFYAGFYVLARRYSGLSFNPQRAAALELRYNDDHRQLIGIDDKTPLLATLVELHVELFGISTADAAVSAHWRVEALNSVDRITGRTSTNVAADWTLIESQLQRCYGDIARLLASR